MFRSQHPRKQRIFIPPTVLKDALESPAAFTPLPNEIEQFRTASSSAQRVQIISNAFLSHLLNFLSARSVPHATEDLSSHLQRYLSLEKDGQASLFPSDELVTDTVGGDLAFVRLFSIFRHRMQEEAGNGLDNFAFKM